MTLDRLENQIREASQEYYDKGLESFFLPKEGEKHLNELITQHTGFECKLVSSYCYGSMREFDMINYRDRNKKILDFKLSFTVDYDIKDGKLLNINIKFGI